MSKIVGKLKSSLLKLPILAYASPRAASMTFPGQAMHRALALGSQPRTTGRRSLETAGKAAQVELWAAATSRFLSNHGALQHDTRGGVASGCCERIRIPNAYAFQTGCWSCTSFYV
eukprot:6196581-Pleurochrysis_carterae.AAC.1